VSRGASRPTTSSSEPCGESASASGPSAIRSSSARSARPIAARIRLRNASSSAALAIASSRASGPAPGLNRDQSSSATTIWEAILRRRIIAAAAAGSMRSTSMPSSRNTRAYSSAPALPKVYARLPARFRSSSVIRALA
jgi:hypothetical protein